MKSTFLITLLIFTLNCTAQKLEVIVSNIDDSKGGLLKAALYNNEDDFLKKGKEFMKFSDDINSNTHRIIFDSLPIGKYSLSVFHDENSNHELDANFLFIPKEGYGFSNNPTFYGPPKWNKTFFEFTEKNQTVSIEISY